jgi:hypothetical protein
MTNAERKAAALQRAPIQTGVSQQYAGIDPAVAKLSPLNVAAPQKASMAPVAKQASAAQGAALAAPDYFGNPNWANSPLPLIATGATTATAGNPLVPRVYASDYAALPGRLAPLLVVINNTVLTNGTLQSFQTWNQRCGTNSPSAGQVFHAYILRPTGVANQYAVVFDSGLQTVPSLPAGSTGQVQTLNIRQWMWSVLHFRSRYR